MCTPSGSGSTRTQAGPLSRGSGASCLRSIAVSPTQRRTIRSIVVLRGRRGRGNPRQSRPRGLRRFLGVLNTFRQLAPHPLNEADDQGVAHAEIPPVRRHACIRPIVRELVESLAFNRRENPVATRRGVLDEVLESTRGCPALARDEGT